MQPLKKDGNHHSIINLINNTANEKTIYIVNHGIINGRHYFCGR